MRNLILLILLLTTVDSIAQLSSPYSRFGLGQPAATNQVTSRGQGNITAALRDSVQTNVSNPAALSGKLFATIDFGVNINYRSQQDASATSNVLEGGIGYIGYSFPVNKAKTWGLGFGILPQTFKGYDITTDIIDNRFITEFEGDGNLNKLYIQNGIKITDELSLGLDAGLLFGQIEDATFNTFLTGTSESVGQIAEQTVRGVLFNLGTQYETELAEDFNLTIGSTYRLESDLTNDVNTETFRFSILSSEVNENGTIDILQRNIFEGEESTEELTTIYPQEVSIGGNVNKKEKWSLGVNATVGFFDDFVGVNDDSSVNYRNSIELGLGGSFIPDFRNPKKAYEGFQYRYGGYFNQTFLTIEDQGINEYGISLGVGLPIRRNTPGARIRQIPSNIDLGVIFGQQGTLDNNLVQDSFIKGSVGLSLNDVWFQKKKYD